jgi:hypothetical protein
MIGPLRFRKKNPVTWTLRRRAYPALLLQLSILYLRSPGFRSFVRFTLRHRRFINMRLLAVGTRGYLFATNSRITISGFGAFVLPHNKASHPDVKTAARFRRRCFRR